MLQENNLAKENLPIELIENSINLFQRKHTEFTEEFYSKDKINLKKLNLKNIYICDFIDNCDLVQAMLEYLTQLEKITASIDKYLKNLDSKNDFRYRIRIKSADSILKKINFYNSREDGKYAINKSLNDLFGGRLILPNINNNKDELERYLNQLKNLDDNCIYKVLKRDITTNSYHAIHIYFQLKNYCFPWELQIWDCKDEKTNNESHIQHDLLKSQ